MMKRKKWFDLISLLMILILIVTSCGSSINEEKVILSGNNSEEVISTEEDDNPTNVSIGRFLQKDITPPDIQNAEMIHFTQDENRGYLLSVFDNDKGEPRAFFYYDGIWEEENNDLAVAFLSDNNIAESTTFYDFSGNWWVFYIKDGLTKGNKLLADGTAQEIELPSYSDTAAINNCLINSTGVLSLSILFNDSRERENLFINIEKGIVIDDEISSKPTSGTVVQLIGNHVLKYVSNEEPIIYDIQSGEKIQSYELGRGFYKASYTTNSSLDLYIVDSLGIHKLEKEGSVIHTMIDDPSFAYADSTKNMWERELLLVDNQEEKYIYLVTFPDGIKIYEYDFDESLPTNKRDSISVWALEDTGFVRAAVVAFIKKYPDCEVHMEFGQNELVMKEMEEKFVDEINDKLLGQVSDDALSRLNAEQEIQIARINDDIIRKLNTKLLAGEAPDVLFLDGLSIDTLYRNGFLSEFDLALEEANYYENILNSYTNGEIAYAYPISFNLPVFISNDVLSDKDNTLAKIADLYQDPKAIEGFTDYRRVFDAFFYPFYLEIFPENTIFSEKGLQEFLVQTNKIADTIPESLMFPGSLASSVSSLGEFHSSLFGIQETVEITPLFKGNYINHNIASIPTDASNKEMAEKFIEFMLSEGIKDNLYHFTVNKENHKQERIVMSEMEVEYDNTVPAYTPNKDRMKDYLDYDWEELINSFTIPVEEDNLMYGIILEQAIRLYSDEITIDEAVAECKKKITIIMAERN